MDLGLTATAAENPPRENEGVDGRDKPGHEGVERRQPSYWLS